MRVAVRMAMAMAMIMCVRLMPMRAVGMRRMRVSGMAVSGMAVSGMAMGRVVVRRRGVRVRGGRPLPLQSGRAFTRAHRAGAGVHIVEQLANGAGAAAALRAAAEAAIHLPHRSHGRRRLRHRAADLTIGKHIAGTHDHRDAKPKFSGV